MNAIRPFLIHGCVAGCLTSLLPAASAQQWARFRGPNGSGESEATTIPAEWTEADFNFKVSLPGIGHSSPVAWDGRVYLLSADPADATVYAVCLDAENGQTLWTRTFASQPHPKHEFNSFASSTPAVDQDHVYIAWANPEQAVLLALDHAGQTVWQRDLGKYVARHGFGTSPIVHGDLVILSNSQQGIQLEGRAPGESHVRAFDRHSGEVRWTTPRQSADVSYASPCLFRPPGGPEQLLLCSTAEGIYSLDPLTGRENWAIGVFDKRTVSSPVIAGGLIFGSAGSGGGGNYLVAVRPGNPPEQAYRIRSQAPYVPTSVARGDLLFLWSDGGIVTCIHAPDGEVIWRERVGGNFFASPVRVANRLYGVARNGDVVVLAAERTYQLLGRNPLGEDSRATPAVADGRMLLRTQSHLISIGGRPR